MRCLMTSYPQPNIKSSINKPEFLKTGLAKIRAHSTTWQLKAIKGNKIRPKADKKAYI